MLPKLSVIPFFIFLAFFAKSQVKQTDTLIYRSQGVEKHIQMVGYPIKAEEMLSMVKKPMSPSDTSHGNTTIIVRDQRIITKSDYPLIIIGGKRFREMNFSNIYFDFSNVSHISVINPQNDSIKLFGRAGRNGVIILATKNKIDWISSNAIRWRYFKSLFFRHKKAAFQVNGVLNDPQSTTYIQKDLIVSATINKSEVFYGDNEYHTVVEVVLKNVMGVSRQSAGK